MGRLVIDGNSVYEIDEACIRRKEMQEKQQKMKNAPQKARDGRRHGRGTI